jgi:hypothetical protein
VKVSSSPELAGRLRLEKAPPTSEVAAPVRRRAPLPLASGVVRSQPGTGRCVVLVPAVRQAKLLAPSMMEGRVKAAVAVAFSNVSFKRLVPPADAGSSKATRVATATTAQLPAPIHRRMWSSSGLRVSELDHVAEQPRLGAERETSPPVSPT